MEYSRHRKPIFVCFKNTELEFNSAWLFESLLNFKKISTLVIKGKGTWS